MFLRSSKGLRLRLESCYGNAILILLQSSGSFVSGTGMVGLGCHGHVGLLLPLHHTKASGSSPDARAPPKDT